MPKYSENLNLRLDDPVADVSQLSRNWFEANFGYTDSNMTKIDSAYKTMKDNINNTPTKSGVGATGNWNINVTGSANSAVHDGAGNDISSSYITSISIGNTSITYTKGDGTNQKETIKTDETLTVKGAAADAKAVGERINAIRIKTDKTLTISGAAADAAAVGNIVLPRLVVQTEAGSAITAVSGDKKVTGRATGGSFSVALPHDGEWTVTATLGTDTATKTVLLEYCRTKTLTLSYIKIYGVCWNYGNSSTACTRLTKASDPNNFVNVDITTEPKAAVGTGSGSSPFDNYMPWKGMDEYNIVNNTIGAKRGESGFSRSSNDVMVYIPEFYYKVVNDASSSKRYFYIADKATTGFEKHPGSGRYVGRYNTISGNYSRTGSSPYVNMSRATARSKARDKGNKWALYDYASWCAVWLLYIVEYANWNSQNKIGMGRVDSHDSSITSGGTDSMTYHTGRASGSDGSTAVQYRHIENPWGNVYEWIDGINFSSDKVYICTDISKYADDTLTNYTYVGAKTQSNGYISMTGYSSTYPWSFYPTSTSGSETTYIPDAAYSGSGWRVLSVGGSWDYGSYAGLFYFHAGNSSSNSSSNIGARLLFVP